MDDVVTVIVGKNGITPSLLSEVNAVLKKRKVIRVKILTTCIKSCDKHELAESLKSACRAKKATLRGHTILLEKP